MEWKIINDDDENKRQFRRFLKKDKLYDYTYEYIYKIYNDAEIADNIWEAISLCRLFHQIRPVENKNEYKVYKNRRFYNI